MPGEWPQGLDVEDMTDIVGSVAGSLSRQYGGFVTIDDVRQELMLWCWRKREKVAEYLVRDDAADRKSGASALMKSLYREGAKYCRREKATASGYEVSDEFFYSTALIEDLIGVIVDGGSAFASQGPTIGRSGGDPAEGGNLMTMIADVQVALDALDEERRDLLLRVHGEGVTYDVIAEEQGVTPQAVRQKATRAAVQVVRNLGGESPWR